MIEFFIAISLHLGLGEGWNNTHPGARYVDGPWSIGAYVNSERGISPFATYTMQNGAWFLEGGIVGGYTGAPILPMVRAGVIQGDVRYFISPGMAVDQYGDVLTGVVLGIEVGF